MGLDVESRPRCLAATSAVAALAISVSACSPGGHPEAPLPPIAIVQGIDRVYLLYPDGKTHFVTTGQNVAWVPGHRMLLVNRVKYINPPSSELWLVSPNGHLIRQATAVYPDQVRFFAAGRDGSQSFVVYDTLKRGLEIKDLSGAAKPRTIPIHVVIDNIAVSPTGAQVAFVTEGRGSSTPITIYTASIRGSPHLKAVLPASPYRSYSIDSGLSWSPDGRWLAITLTADQGSEGPFFTAIWLVHPDGSDLHMLAKGYDPAWSPDGAWISYISTQGLNTALFKIRPNGTDPARLTKSSSSASGVGDSQPSW